MRYLLIVALVSVAAGIPAAQGQVLVAVEALSPSAPKAGGGCTALVARPSGSPAGPGVFADGFESGDTSAWGAVALRATQIVDLLVEAALPDGWSGDALLEINLLAPSGALYERQTIAVSSTATGDLARKVAGYPHPLAVTRVGGSAAAGGVGGGLPTARFAVAGSTIVSSGLYGSWSATAALGESETPCWTPVTFELVP